MLLLKQKQQIDRFVESDNEKCSLIQNIFNFYNSGTNIPDVIDLDNIEYYANDLGYLQTYSTIFYVLMKILSNDISDDTLENLVETETVFMPKLLEFKKILDFFASSENNGDKLNYILYIGQYNSNCYGKGFYPTTTCTTPHSSIEDTGSQGDYRSSIHDQPVITGPGL